MRLTPMTEEDFQRWREPKIRQYGIDKARAGNWEAADAQRLSEQSFREMLPQGLATPGQYLFALEDETASAKVGFLWFVVNRDGPHPAVFVYDFIIFEAFRRQGYAEQAFRQLEAQVKAMELDTIALHVFGHNHAA